MPSWSEAFAVQANSDLDTFELLEKSGLPICHRLHYLQMWLEKLSKAFLWVPESGADDLRFKHNVVGRVLPSLISRHRRRLGLVVSSDLAAIREICRQIDLLHPQVDDNGRRPENAEYPWVDNSGQIKIPAQWKFVLADRLYTSPGRILRKAAILLTRNTSEFLR